MSNLWETTMPINEVEDNTKEMYDTEYEMWEQHLEQLDPDVREELYKKMGVD